jgi:hypothetical protein
MDTTQAETWASQIRDLFVRVCAATGDGRILREPILANLDDITSPDAVEHLETATELLDLLAAAVSESEDPNHITWPGHLWHELSNAAADLAEHLANNTPEDHCGDVQAHIDYLNAALQVPTHLTGAFRTAAEDHTPTEALTLIAGSDTRLSLPAITTICQTLHATTADLATRTPPTAPFSAPETWGPDTPPPTEPTAAGDVMAGLRRFLLGLRWHAEQITLTADDPTTHAQWDRVLDAATTLLHFLDDDLTIATDNHVRDPLESVHWLQRAATIQPDLLTTWTMLAADHDPTHAYHLLFNP